MRSVARIARLGALALAGIVAGCGSPAPSPATSVLPDPLPSPAQAQASDDHYVLFLVLPRTTWQASEAITGTAILTLVEPPTMTVWGSGSGIVGFTYERVGNHEKRDWVRTADCGPHHLAASSPLVIALDKTWVMPADATPDPLIHLPPGEGRSRPSRRSTSKTAEAALTTSTRR